MKVQKHQHFLSIFAILAILLIGSQQAVIARPVHERPATETIISGEAGNASARATQTLAEIERQEAILGVNPALDVPPFMTVSENNPAEVINSPTAEIPAAITINSPSPANSFLALQDNISSIPPDTHGAAGPNHLMTTLNSQVRIQNRSGTNLSTVSLNSFWSSVNGGSGTFDPKVLYDPYNNRWIAVACDDSRSATSAFSLAVSANSDPTGTWYFFRVQLNDGTNWIDYPSLGFNKNWIVVNVNIFTTAGSFVRTEVYAFDKATTYVGSSAPYTRFSTTSAFTLVPAITYDNSLNTEYLVMTYSSTSGIIRMGRITGSIGAESLTLDSTNITSPLGGWSSAPAGSADFAPQLGSSQKIQNNDHRMQNLVYRNGYLWTTHTVFLPSGGSPTRSAVQWWQISPSGYGIVQNGRIDDGTGTNFYAFPSIAVNQNNDVLIGFSRYSANQYASGNYAFRNSDDPINTMRTDVVLKAGEAPYYKTYSGTRNRWGDYSNTVVDPANDTDFWTIQEYAWTNNGTYDRWGTWWGQIVPPPAAFAKSSPSDGATGQSFTPTLLWGSSSGATSYDYCYDTSNNNTCDSTWASAGVNTSATLSGLAASTTYYWQVRANNTYGSTHANADTWWSFTTQSAPPADFNKLSPGDGALDQLLNPTLSWESSSGASSYEYCYDTADDDSCNGSWTNVGSNTSAALSGLSANTTYYWHVRGRNGSGDTYANTDTWWSFTTQTLSYLYLPVILKP